MESLERDFYFDEGGEVVVDIFNNALYLRSQPSDGHAVYMHPKDRNNRILRNRYTTEDVNEKLRDYIGATQECRAEVASALKNLSTDICRLEEGLDGVLECGYINMIIEVRTWRCVCVCAASCDYLLLPPIPGLHKARSGGP